MQCKVQSYRIRLGFSEDKEIYVKQIKPYCPNTYKKKCRKKHLEYARVEKSLEYPLHNLEHNNSTIQAHNII